MCRFIHPNVVALLLLISFSAHGQSTSQRLDLLCLTPGTTVPSGYIVVDRKLIPSARLATCPQNFSVVGPQNTPLTDKLVAAMASGTVTVTCHKLLRIGGDTKVEDIQKNLGMYMVPPETAKRVAPRILDTVKSK